HHEARHRPSGAGFAIADRIGYLNPIQWDQLTNSNSVFFRRSWLQAVESTGPTNIEQRYALIFDRAEPIAAAVFQIVSLQAGHVLRTEAKSGEKQHLLKDRLRPAAKKLGELVRERVLVCGNLMSWGFHAVSWKPGVSSKKVWPAVAEAIYRIRR